MNPTTNSVDKCWQTLIDMDLGEVITYSFDGTLSILSKLGVFYLNPITGNLDYYIPEGEVKILNEHSGGHDWIMTDTQFFQVKKDLIIPAPLFDEDSDYVCIIGQNVSHDKSRDYGFFTKDKEPYEKSHIPHWWNNAVPPLGEWRLFGHHLFTVNEEMEGYHGMQAMRPFIGVQPIKKQTPMYDIDVMTSEVSEDSGEDGEYENKYYIFHNGHTYLLLEEQEKTWQENINFHYLERNIIDGRHLVTPNDAEENQWIIETIQNSPYYENYRSMIIQLGMRFLKIASWYVNRLYLEEQYGTNIIGNYTNWWSSYVPDSQIIYPIMYGMDAGTSAAGKWGYLMDGTASLNNVKPIVMLEWNRILTIEEMLTMEDLAKYAPVKKGTEKTYQLPLQIYDYKKELWGVGFTANTMKKTPIGKLRIYPALIDTEGTVQEFYASVLPMYQINITAEELERFTLGFSNDVPLGFLEELRSDYCSSSEYPILYEIPTNTKKYLKPDKTIMNITESNDDDSDTKTAKEEAIEEAEGEGSGFIGYDHLTHRMLLFDGVGIKYITAKGEKSEEDKETEEGEDEEDNEPHDPELENVFETVELKTNDSWDCASLFEWTVPSRKLEAITKYNIFSGFDNAVINTNVYQMFYREFYTMYKKESGTRFSSRLFSVKEEEEKETFLRIAIKSNTKGYQVLPFYFDKIQTEEEISDIELPDYEQEAIDRWENAFRNPFKNFQLINSFKGKYYPTDICKSSGYPVFCSHAETQITYFPSNAEENYVSNFDVQYSSIAPSHVEKMYVKVFGIDLTTGRSLEEKEYTKTSRYEIVWIGNDYAQLGIRSNTIGFSYNNLDDTIEVIWVFSNDGTYNPYEYEQGEVLFTPSDGMKEWKTIQTESTFVPVKIIFNGVYEIGEETLMKRTKIFRTDNPTVLIKHRESGITFALELPADQIELPENPYGDVIGVFEKDGKIVFVCAVMELFQSPKEEPEEEEPEEEEEEPEEEEAASNLHYLPTWGNTGTGDNYEDWCALETDCTYIVFSIEYDKEILNFNDFVIEEEEVKDDEEE